MLTINFNNYSHLQTTKPARKNLTLKYQSGRKWSVKMTPGVCQKYAVIRQMSPGVHGNHFFLPGVHQGTYMYDAHIVNGAHCPGVMGCILQLTGALLGMFTNL